MWLLSSPSCAESTAAAARAAASITESMVPGTGSLNADQARSWARFSAAASSGRAQPVVACEGLGGGAEEDGEQGPGVAARLFHGGLACLGEDGADVVLGRIRRAERMH